MVPFVIILIAIGLFLVFLEIMLPSGGILGLLATSAIISALVIAFKEGGNGGYMVFLFLLFALPAVIGISFKWLPKSPFGKICNITTGLIVFSKDQLCIFSEKFLYKEKLCLLNFSFDKLKSM